MAQVTYSGPMKIGTVKEGASVNLGSPVLSQSGILQAASVAAVDLTFNLPVGAQIVDIITDNLVLWTATGAVGLTVGTTSAGTQYKTSGDLKSIVRTTNSGATAAQLTAMADIGTTTTVVATATTASGSNATGTTRVTVLYVQK